MEANESKAESEAFGESDTTIEDEYHVPNEAVTTTEAPADESSTTEPPTETTPANDDTEMTPAELVKDMGIAAPVLVNAAPVAKSAAPETPTETVEEDEEPIIDPIPNMV